MATTSSSRSGTSLSSSSSSLTERQRDNVLNDLIDAIIDRSEITSAQIARRRRVSVGSVAAVRANMTRGSYGTQRSLVNRRRNERRG